MQNPEEIYFEFSDSNFKKDFPASELEPNGKLKCKELSFDFLKEVALKTHHKMISGEWTKNTAKSFLRRYCFSGSLQTEVTDHALNKLTISNIEMVATEHESRILRDMERNDKDAFAKWNLPPAWTSGIEIQQFTEPCMHQLFLGIEKNFVFLIQEWSALQGKYASLRKLLGRTTREVEVLHLSWIKMQPYVGEKLGGWVSENYMAFS